MNGDTSYILPASTRTNKRNLSGTKDFEAHSGRLTSHTGSDRTRSSSASPAPLPNKKTHGRFLPVLSPHQYLFLLYPIIILYGSFYYLPSAESESYFSQKTNIFNRIFAKNGWGWTTIAFAIYVIGQRQSGWHKAIVRWIMATVYWYALTQWCFGPSVFDRVYVYTGGKCSVDGHFTGRLCKMGGGEWHGGHDVSGHGMLLVHSSLFLIEEMSETFYRLFDQVKTWHVASAAALIALWAVMLFYTAVYFHDLPEMLSGLFAGSAYWAVAYGWLFRHSVFPGLPHAHYY
ncbi:uncharacterized protein VTP21DRAFT_2199 [Calcarisporiella thermophila]|uniref:uncharacterized protein n=1 Tax=Calcarisporiella thermophila TaxID=911321 RepID=UPI003742C4CA